MISQSRKERKGRTLVYPIPQGSFSGGAIHLLVQACLVPAAGLGSDIFELPRQMNQLLAVFTQEKVKHLLSLFRNVIVYNAVSDITHLNPEHCRLDETVFLHTMHQIPEGFRGFGLLINLIAPEKPDADFNGSYKTIRKRIIRFQFVMSIFPGNIEGRQLFNR